jgi:hypothetical protein
MNLREETLKRAHERKEFKMPLSDKGGRFSNLKFH